MTKYWHRIIIGLALAAVTQVACAYLRSFHEFHDIYHPDGDAPGWVLLFGLPIQVLYWSLPAFVGALFVKRYKWLMGAAIAIVGPEFVNLALQPGLGFPPPPPGAPLNIYIVAGAALGHAMTGAFAGAATLAFARPAP